MSRYRSDTAPPAAPPAASRMTRKRCRREKSMIQLSMGRPPGSGPHAFRQTACGEYVALEKVHSSGSRTGCSVAAPSALAEVVLEQLGAEGAAALGRHQFTR